MGRRRRRDRRRRRGGAGSARPGRHGLPHVWFAAQVGGQPPVIRRIERDEAFIADLTAAEEEFWQLVEARTPPALEGRASADLIARLYPDADDGKTAELSAEHVALLREYRKELANENAAKARKDEIKAVITAAMGDAAIATHDGQVVARWADRKKTSVPKEDIAVLREKYPDVAAEVITDKRIPPVQRHSEGGCVTMGRELAARAAAQRNGNGRRTAGRSSRSGRSRSSLSG